MGFQLTVFENKRTSTQTTTLMQWKSRQVFRNLFSVNQGNGSDMTSVAGASKISLKNLKT